MARSFLEKGAKYNQNNKIDKDRKSESGSGRETERESKSESQFFSTPE